MMATLFILFAFAAVAVAGVVSLVGLLARVVIGLILLPFRLIGWLLWIPVLIVKALMGAVFGLFAFLPVVLLAIAVAAAVLVALPALPLLLIAVGIWIFSRASARPAAV